MMHETPDTSESEQILADIRNVLSKTGMFAYISYRNTDDETNSNDEPALVIHEKRGDGTRVEWVLIVAEIRES